MHDTIRSTHTSATDPRQAALEFHASVAQPNMELVVFFCSPEYELETLAYEFNRLFAGVKVVGCTTAGEIGPGGYREHSLAGVSFSGHICTAVSGHIDDLEQFDISVGQVFSRHLLQELENREPKLDSRSSFGLVLIDGLSIREEPVSRAFQSSLGKIPLVGGSAADGLHFRRTFVYVDGEFRTSCAALILVSTPLPVKAFRTQHFVPTSDRFVITQANPAKRTVYEINGLPAAQEYARLLRVDLQDLSPLHIAASPVVVLIDGHHYVRSIQKVNSDNSITFFCAIDEGLVLRVARGVNLVENLEEAFAGVRAEIGIPRITLSCDCILRRLEIVHDHLEGRVEEVLRRNNAVGFNTYGEQFRGVHVNQTFSGVAVGSTPSEERNA